MDLTAEHDARLRSRHLLACLALAAAFTIAAWSRLALPFSTSEATFVHESLRSSGHVTSPAFGESAGSTPPLVLRVIQQLVGTTERSLRLVVLALIAAAGCFLAEMVPHPRLAGAVTPVLAFLATAALGRGELVRPELLVLLPASLALLAAPLASPVTNVRGVLGLAGALSVGALGFQPALLTAAILVGASCIRGSLLDRLTGIVTAAASVAMAWVLHGPGWLDLSGFFASAKDAASGITTSGVVTDSRLALFATLPLLVLLLTLAANALGAVVRVAFALVLVAAVVIPLWRAAPPRDATAITVLEQARSVAQPGSALAVEGPARISVAVYARLGRFPGLPTIFLPEHTTLENLPDLCRQLSIRLVWIYPPREEVPPGFAAPESRPAGAPALMPLVVEGS